MIIWQIFIVLIYQPLFNALLFFYWLLNYFWPDRADMGWAVIALTILVRVILLPLTLSATRSERERRLISDRLSEFKKKYSDNPIAYRQAVKTTFRSNRRIVISEISSLVVQTVVALSLWRIFSYGLEGEDLHLAYSFLPRLKLPFNLMFLGKFSLNEPHWQLNLLQSLLVFILETLSILTSPFPIRRSEVIRMQLTLPLVSFLIFSVMPAGKKLFVITSLIFSIVFTIAKFFYYQWREKVVPLVKKIVTDK